MTSERNTQETQTMTAPCKDCQKRYSGCHSVCEDYIEYSKECERIRQQRNRESQAKHDIFSTKYRFKLAQEKKRHTRRFK